MDYDLFKEHLRWSAIGLLIGLLIIEVFLLIIEIIDYTGLFEQVGVLLR